MLDPGPRRTEDERAGAVPRFFGVEPEPETAPEEAAVVPEVAAVVAAVVPATELLRSN